MASACSSVRAERLAMVRFLMRVPSRMFSTQQDGGFGASVGHEVDIHAAKSYCWGDAKPESYDALHGYTEAPVSRSSF